MSDVTQELDEFSRVVVAKLEKSYPDCVQQVIFFLGELTVVVDRTSIRDVGAFLRDDADLGFNALCDLSAVDLWPDHPRFEVNIHLLVLSQEALPGEGTRRLRLKVRIPEHDARMPSLTSVWPSSAWYERETHELFGIGFDGHPDLRPLLLPENYAGTPPLRRDVPTHVEEVAFSFNRNRIYLNKHFARE